jgi:hypothetical protein
MKVAGPLLKRFEPSAGKRVSSMGFSYNGTVHLHRLAAFHALEKVEFTNNVKLAPPEKDPFVAVPSVDTVVIRYANLDGGLQELDFLKRFPNLRSLAIRESTITPAAFERIEEAQVESLELYVLYWSAFNPQADFSKLKRLHRLKVDNGLLRRNPHWLNSAPTIRHLIVAGYSSDTQRVFENLALPELRSAEIRAMSLQEVDFITLLRQPQLTELTIAGVFTGGEPLRHLQDAHIESLTLMGNMLDDDALAKLAQIHTLRRLELNEPLMQYQKLDQLRDLPLLEELKVPAIVPASARPKLKKRS